MGENLDRSGQRRWAGSRERRCMYWHSLRDAPETHNDTTTTVYVSRKQIIDLESLRRLMAAAARQEAL